MNSYNGKKAGNPLSHISPGSENREANPVKYFETQLRDTNLKLRVLRQGLRVCGCGKGPVLSGFRIMWMVKFLVGIF